MLFFAKHFRMSQTEIKKLQPKVFNKKLSERGGDAAAKEKTEKKSAFTVQSVVNQLHGSKF
jgi:hypothetical protein